MKYVDCLKNNRTYIVAEMSANHLQDLARAKRIIEAAQASGADAVKLQTYRPDTITIDCKGEEFMATPGSPWDGMNLYELYSQAYTPWEWHAELFEYAADLGLEIFSSPFDLTAVDFLEELNAPIYKIASFEINDIPLIEKAAATGKPIILSTGIAELSDISLAVQACRDSGNNNITLLKCVSEYPAPYEDMNLRTIPNLGATFDCHVGLSDHSLGDEVAVASVVLGAGVIEKHFTLSRADGGPDAQFSMEPEEFRQLVNKVHAIEKALGKVTYDLTDKQKASKGRGRSLYIVADMKRGDILTPENLKSIRPGYGLHTKYYKELLGRKVAQDLKAGTAMKWDFLQDD